MDTEDKAWGSFAEAALLHEQGFIPVNLNSYSPDIHGTIFDTGSTQQRWLVEFGVSAASSARHVNGLGALDVERTRDEIFASAGELYGPLATRLSSASGTPSGIAASQNTQQQQQSVVGTGIDVRADEEPPGQVYGHYLPQLTAKSELTMQQAQQGSMQPADTLQQEAAAPAQQKEQQLQHEKPQLQASQLMQEQQPVLGTSQQQLWGLQQQLWGLQQQAALIAQQQQQFQHGGLSFHVLPQMTLQTVLPLLNGSGFPGTGAAVYAPGTLQQHSAAAAVPGLSNMAMAHRGPAVGGVLGAAPFSTAAVAGAKSSSAGTGNMAHPHHVVLAKPLPVAKKHRERHRSVVSTLEAELSGKLAQLQMLSAENEMLKLRAAVLEATVQSREDQMRVISQHGPPVYPIDAHNPAPRSGPSATATTSTSATGETDSPTAASIDAAVGTTAVSGMPHSNSMQNMQVERQSGGSAAAGEVAKVSALLEAGPNDGAAAAAAAAAVMGSAAARECAAAQAEQPPSHMADLQDFQRDANGTRETIKQMCVDDIIRHWKQFLQDVTGELVNVQKEESLAALQQQAGRLPGSCAAAMSGAALPNDVVAALLQQRQHPPAASASHQRINQLVAKYSFLIKTAQQLNPSAYCRLFGTNLDTGLPAPYSDAHWRRVVQVLDLTKHQVNHILACAELYFSCRAKLQNEQRALQQQLKQSFASTEGLLLLANVGDASVADAASSPSKPQLDQLANNLKREHVLRVMLNSFVWGKIFTPVQCAKAAVYSHPWYIDVHAIVCVMCEDALTAPAAHGQRPLVFPHRLQQPCDPPQQVVTQTAAAL